MEAMRIMSEYIIKRERILTLKIGVDVTLNIWLKAVIFVTLLLAFNLLSKSVSEILAIDYLMAVLLTVVLLNGFSIPFNFRRMKKFGNNLYLFGLLAGMVLGLILFCMDYEKILEFNFFSLCFLLAKLKMVNLIQNSLMEFWLRKI